MYQIQNHAACESNTLVSATVSNDVKNCLQCFTVFDLLQIKKSRSRITCSSTTLIDHMLGGVPERISQKGVVNVGLSDYQLIYCTRKTSRIKTEVCTKNKFRSLKNYAVDAYKKALSKRNFKTTDTLKMSIGRIQTSLKN